MMGVLWEYGWQDGFLTRVNTYDTADTRQRYPLLHQLQFVSSITTVSGSEISKSISVNSKQVIRVFLKSI